MTNTQARAIWELCRQGFPLSADEAEASWQKGQPYRPDWPLKVSRALQQLIEDCNRDTDGHWETI